MNPALWLDRAGRLWPARSALFHGTEMVADYAGFRERAGRLAAGLIAAGIAPGDRIALFVANRTDYLVVMQAAWWVGAVVVPVNYKLHPKETAWIIGHSGAVMVFTDRAHAPDLAALCPGLRVIDMDNAEFAALIVPGALPALHVTGQQDPVWLFYTSGTTGRPKGVMLTSANLQAMVLSYQADVAQPQPGDAKLYAAPMSHGAGLYQFQYVIAGARHVVPASGGFDGEEVLALGAALGRLVFFAAPTMIRRLVAATGGAGGRDAGISRVIYGGGPMYLADLQEAIACFGQVFTQIYGQGESPMTISVLSHADHCRLSADGSPEALQRLASVGTAQATCELAVLSDDGQPLPPGGIGEIAVRGPSVMAGYWNNEEATATTICDGWLRTGDLGALDAQGYLTLHDRKKDVIVSGGTNIYPREVEEVLLSHPAVAEATVIGTPDAEWGEAVLACIVLQPGTGLSQPEAGRQLDAHCLASIARFKRPKTYRFLQSLPKNAYGKVLKTALREMPEITGPGP